MDFDSPDPDVEKEFPGLYGSDSGGSRKREDEDCKNLVSEIGFMFRCYLPCNTHFYWTVFL